MGSATWGERWLQAVVSAGVIDPSHLGRARGAAARGAVTGLVVEPVSASASVLGRSSLERRVRLGVRRTPAGAWPEAAAAIALSSRWVAAVIGGELPDALHVRLVTAGVDLLPGTDDVSVDCSCGDALDRCVHAASLCCHLAAAIDADPLLLVTLRGGDRAQLVGPVAASLAGPRPASVPGVRSSSLPGRPDDPTMTGAHAWRRRVAELSAPGLHRRPVGRPRAGAHAPSAELGFDQAGLDRLVRDAAQRAYAVLAGVGRSWLELDQRVDAVRRLASGGVSVTEAASAVGCTPDTALTLAEAWRASGPVGVDVLVSPRRLDPAEVALVEAWAEVPVRQRSTGALLGDGRQVRRASDGTWVVLRPDTEVGWVIVDWSTTLSDLSPA